MSHTAITTGMPDLSRAICKGREEFDDINTLTAYRASLVCRSGCPVFWACRGWGVRHEIHGCWGGLAGKQLANERRRLKIKVDEIRISDFAPRITKPTGARA